MNSYKFIFIFLLTFCLFFAQDNLSLAKEKQKDEPIEQSQTIKLEEQKNTLFSELEETDSTKEEPSLEGSISELSRFNKFLGFMKGEKAQNQIQAGMWSKHFSSHKNYREVNNLGALQYKGYWAGTFSNSHSKQVVAVMVARNVMKKELAKDLIFDAGYKIGPMYGYDEGAPNIAKFSILPVACFALSYQDVGVSLNLFPSSAISFYTFINTDFFKKFIPNKKNTDPKKESEL